MKTSRPPAALASTDEQKCSSCAKRPLSISGHPIGLGGAAKCDECGVFLASEPPAHWHRL